MRTSPDLAMRLSLPRTVIAVKLLGDGTMNRRHFLLLSSSALLGASLTDCTTPRPGRASAIDRQQVVQRHNPRVTRFDPFSALSIGNGEFAFTADITGLQTFTEQCQAEFPLCTASHWAWHTAPGSPSPGSATGRLSGVPFPSSDASFGIPSPGERQKLRWKDYDTYGRPVPYPTDSSGQEFLFNWLRQNPHRLNLGRIGLNLTQNDGQPASPESLQDPIQTLDLWSGHIVSRFRFLGAPVSVETCAHPVIDALAARLESPLLASGRVAVLLAFPYGSPEVHMSDWSQPNAHQTSLTRERNRALFTRRLDHTSYTVTLEWKGEATLTETAPHHYSLTSRAGQLEFTCAFSNQPAGTLPSFAQVRDASATRWKSFWSEGGAVDLGNCTDPRAPELERRTILSLYNTALHCAGSLPSAETGLLFNSWYGKFHLEMHWWHSVHFTAWNRFSLFERSIGLYRRILPIARELARRQGYAGARWPKMIAPDGHDSPSPVGPLLIWQQPHPIYYAELCYRNNPSRRTLDEWREIVLESAEFMVSYAVQDASGRFVLGPPLKTVSENTDPVTAKNPTFELTYWRFGLRIAQAWRERLGLGRNPGWDRVLHNLARVPSREGLYLMEEGLPDTYTRWNWEHPALVGAFGMLPGDGIEPAVMRASIRKVMEVWQWNRTWGWDFGMAAMAAARSGEPELAVRALLIDAPKNLHHPNGHNYQRPNLTAYLPGNGSHLCAVAMMAGGWMGSGRSTPGFPRDGGWAVKAESLSTWL